MDKRGAPAPGRAASRTTLWRRDEGQKRWRPQVCLLLGLGLFGSLAFGAAMTEPGSEARAQQSPLPIEPGSVPDIQPSDATLADVEVSSLAAADGVSLAEARAALLAQRQLPLLINAARERLGTSLGGVWVDHHRIKVGVVAPPGGVILPPDASAAARQAIADAHLQDAGVDLVPSLRSEAELLALQDQLDRLLVTVNEGAPVTVDVETDVRSGTVKVDVPPEPTAPG